MEMGKQLIKKYQEISFFPPHMFISKVLQIFKSLLKYDGQMETFKHISRSWVFAQVFGSILISPSFAIDDIIMTNVVVT